MLWQRKRYNLGVFVLHATCPLCLCENQYNNNNSSIASSRSNTPTALTPYINTTNSSNNAPTPKEVTEQLQLLLENYRELSQFLLEFPSVPLERIQIELSNILLLQQQQQQQDASQHAQPLDFTKQITKTEPRYLLHEQHQPQQLKQPPVPQGDFDSDDDDDDMVNDNVVEKVIVMEDHRHETGSKSSSSSSTALRGSSHTHHGYATEGYHTNTTKSHSSGSSTSSPVVKVMTTTTTTANSNHSTTTTTTTTHTIDLYGWLERSIRDAIPEISQKIYWQEQSELEFFGRPTRLEQWQALLDCWKRFERLYHQQTTHKGFYASVLLDVLSQIDAICQSLFLLQQQTSQNTLNTAIMTASTKTTTLQPHHHHQSSAQSTSSTTMSLSSRETTRKTGGGGKTSSSSSAVIEQGGAEDLEIMALRKHLLKTQSYLERISPTTRDPTKATLETKLRYVLHRLSLVKSSTPTTSSSNNKASFHTPKSLQSRREGGVAETKSSSPTGSPQSQEEKEQQQQQEEEEEEEEEEEGAGEHQQTQDDLLQKLHFRLGSVRQGMMLLFNGGSNADSSGDDEGKVSEATATTASATAASHPLPSESRQRLLAAKEQVSVLQHKIKSTTKLPLHIPQLVVIGEHLENLQNVLWSETHLEGRFRARLEKEFGAMRQLFRQLLQTLMTPIPPLADLLAKLRQAQEPARFVHVCQRINALYAAPPPPRDLSTASGLTPNTHDYDDGGDLMDDNNNDKHDGPYPAPHARSVKPTLMEVQIFKNGGLVPILTAIEQWLTDQDVQTQAFTLLENMSQYRMLVQVLVEREGIHRIIGSMQAFPNHSSLQTMACHILGQAVLWATPHDSRLVPPVDVVRAIVLAMYQHVDRVELHQVACQALWYMASRPERSLKAAVGKGVQGIVYSMKRHSHDLTIQHCGCGALWNLAYSKQVDRRKTITAFGGIQVVLEAIENHRPHANLQQQAFGLLRNMVVVTENQPIVVKGGGVQSTFGTIQQHPMESKIQTHCLGTLKNLAMDNPQHKTLIEAANEHSIDSIVLTLQVHEWVAAVQEQGLGLLLQLWSKCPQRIVSAEGILRVKAAMAIHLDRADIQALGCALLWKMVESKINRTWRGVSQAIGLVVRAMQNHVHKVDVQHNACGVLSALAHTEANQREIAVEGGIEAVVDAMTNHPQEGEVQCYGCAALWNLAVNVDNRVFICFSEGGAVDSIIRAMRTHRANVNVALYGTGAICNLTRAESTKQIVADAGGVTAVIGCMMQHSMSRMIQFNGAGALCNLALVHGDEVVEAGGIRVVLTGMRQFRASADVQRYGCAALWNIARGREEHQKEIAQLWGIQDVLVALQTHTRNVSVQECGCAALAHLARHVDNKTTIRDLSGIEVLLGIMKQFPQHGTIQRHICDAFWRLTVDDKNRSLLHHLAGCSLVADTMTHHRSNPRLQESGCGALWNLAANPMVRRSRDMTQDGLNAIFGALRIHRADVHVQQYGCAALQNISFENEYNKASIVSRGGVDDILLAMRHHKPCPEVQMFACGALMNLSSHIRQLIVKRYGVVETLAAMNEHPRHAKLQVATCGALRYLGQHQDPPIMASVIDKLLVALVNHKPELEVCRQACNSLFELAVPHFNKERMKSVGVRAAVESALLEHPNDDYLTWYGERLLNRLGR